MDQNQFFALADQVARETGVESGHHQTYFHIHRSRLWKTGAHFALWDLRGKSVLDVGPFYSYVPFALREHSNEVTVVEGRSESLDPLRPAYARRQITFCTVDLSDIFLARTPEQRRLPFADGAFEVVNCWETMEHFNFNPVGFVKEIHRILKPGGQAFITVPNMAKLESRLHLLFGRSIRTPIDDYYQCQEADEGRFLGFHWREYVLAELLELFKRQSFRLESAGHLQTFQDRTTMNFGRKLKRAVGALACALVPSLSSICCLRATRL